MDVENGEDRINKAMALAPLGPPSSYLALLTLPPPCSAAVLGDIWGP